MAASAPAQSPSRATASRDRTPQFCTRRSERWPATLTSSSALSERLLTSSLLGEWASVPGQWELNVGWLGVGHALCTLFCFLRIWLFPGCKKKFLVLSRAGGNRSKHTHLSLIWKINDGDWGGVHRTAPQSLLMDPLVKGCLWAIWVAKCQILGSTIPEVGGHLPREALVLNSSRKSCVLAGWPCHSVLSA